MGGGGGFDPFQAVGDALASIDPGPAIGQGLAEVDDFVNDEIPGGWVLPAAVAVAATTGYMDPSLLGGEAAFTGMSETGLATLAGEGAVADTVGTTLLAGGSGASAIPMELLPEMIPGGIPVDPGISLGQAQLNAGVIPMELVPEMIPEGIPVDPGISLAEGQLNAGVIPSELKDALSAANKARQVYNLLSGVGGTMGARNVSGLGQYTTPTTTTTASGMQNIGIPNLTAGIVRGQPIDLNIDQFNAPLAPINAAEGGSTDSYTDTNYQDTVSGLSKLKPNLLRGKSDFGLQKYWNAPAGHADGGSIEGHNPEFFSEGGLQNRYVKGEGDGTSDDVPAMLANGEFVIPADVVSSLGNGSNDSGAHILDEFLQVIRDHKRKADSRELPPDSKGALGYLLEAKRKAR